MKKYYILIFLVLLTTMGYCQYPAFQNITNGKAVNCILKDGNYIWIGTTAGLVKMEKSSGSCVFYTKTNSGIPHLWITSLLKDLSGNLWVGTRGGVARFDGQSWSVFSSYLNSNEPLYLVNCLAVKQDGSVWVGTFDAIYKFFNNTWTTYTTTVTHISNVESMVFDNNGILYAGSATSGMSRFDGATWTHYTTANSGMLNNRIHDLAIDSQNNIWACSYLCGGPGGLTKFDGTTFTMHLLNTNIESIAIDSIDNIWFSSYPPSRLSKWDGNTIVSFDSSNSQITDIWNDMLIDGPDIWFGTAFNDGIKKFDGNSTITSYNTNEYQISNNNNLDIAVDSNGVVWLGCVGLDRYDQNGFTNLNINNSGLPVEYVNSITVDGNNNLWMGSSNGLIKYDGTNFTHFDSATYNFPCSKVNKPVFDSAGNVYILFGWSYDANGDKYGGGIKWFDGSTWSDINLSAITDTNIAGIAIDKQNQLWAFGVTATGGAVIEKHNLFSPVIFTSSNAPFAFADDFSSMAVDNNNNIWITTYFAKLYRIQNSQTVTQYDISPCSTFPGWSDITQTMTIDRNNTIWIPILDFCSDDSRVLAKFDGSTFTYFKIINSGLSVTPDKITTRGNKIYMATPTGPVIYTDPTQPTAIDENATNNDILEISPNPSPGSFSLYFHSGSDNSVKFELLNIQGKVVYMRNNISSFQGTNEINLDFTELNSGVYICKLTSGDSVNYARVVLTD